jgi:RNA polymerase sigma-70 factor (ECF subfamily)
MDYTQITPELLAAARAGDQNACTRLFELTASSVYRLAYSLLLHRQDAEDVVQEVFVYAFGHLAQYDPQRGAFFTWLYTITVSRSRNARRRKWLPTIDLGQLLQIGLEPSAPEEDNPESTAIRHEAYQALGRALAQLSPRLHEAIVLRYTQQLTYKEMSAILNCPEKTAESRVRLAHAALRQHLQTQETALVDRLMPLADA